MAGELWQASTAIGREILGSAEVQTLTTTGVPTGGTFTLSYNGQTTAGIAFNAAAAAVQTALRLLPGLTGTVITAGGGPLPTAVTLTFSGTLLGPQPLITANSAGLTGGTTPTATVARTTPGVSSIGVAVPATRKAYFNTDLVLSRTRTPRPHAFMVGRRDNNLAVTMGPVQAGGTANFPISSSEIIEPLLCSVRGAVVPTSLTAGSAEVQTITGNNTPTGGTFTLSFLGQTTAPIAFNATAAAIGTALNLLTTITAAGGVGVPTGGPFPTAVVVTFTAVGNQPSIIGNGAALTGAGAQPTVTVAETTPGVPSVNRWVFTPGNILDSQTWQWFDGARAWNEVGVRGGSLKVTGDVNNMTTVTLTLAGQNLLAGPITGGLADRTPDFAEGWETRLFLDPFGSAPGQTPVDGTMISWDFTLNNNPDWKYLASNTLSAAAVLLGNIALAGTIKFEAAPQTAITEFANWDGNGTANPVLRMMRLQFGNNNLLSAGFPTFVTFDIPISWSSFSLGETDGASRAYSAAFQYVYDSSNAFGLSVTCQNNRTTAYV